MIGLLLAKINRLDMSLAKFVTSIYPNRLQCFRFTLAHRVTFAVIRERRKLGLDPQMVNTQTGPTVFQKNRWYF